MTEDVKLIEWLRNGGTYDYAKMLEAADRLASLIAQVVELRRDLIARIEEDAGAMSARLQRITTLSAEVAEYRQSLNVLGERYDAKCEELKNLRDSERFKVD